MSDLWETKASLRVIGWRLNGRNPFAEFQIQCDVERLELHKRYCVWRRYSQIRELYHTLLHAGVFSHDALDFPKITVLKDVSAEFLDERARQLQEFFGAITELPNIWDLDQSDTLDGYLGMFFEIDNHLMSNFAIAHGRENGERQISVVVCDPVVSGFALNRVSYFLLRCQSTSKTWSCRRTFADFYNLQTTLKKELNISLSFPSKAGWFASEDVTQEALEARQAALQTFVDELLAVENIWQHDERALGHVVARFFNRDFSSADVVEESDVTATNSALFTAGKGHELRQIQTHVESGRQVVVNSADSDDMTGLELCLLIDRTEATSIWVPCAGLQSQEELVGMLARCIAASGLGITIGQTSEVGELWRFFAGGHDWGCSDLEANVAGYGTADEIMALLLPLLLSYCRENSVALVLDGCDCVELLPLLFPPKLIDSSSLAIVVLPFDPSVDVSILEESWGAVIVDVPMIDQSLAVQCLVDAILPRFPDAEEAKTIGNELYTKLIKDSVPALQSVAALLHLGVKPEAIMAQTEDGDLSGLQLKLLRVMVDEHDSVPAMIAGWMAEKVLPFTGKAPMPLELLIACGAAVFRNGCGFDQENSGHKRRRSSDWKDSISLDLLRREARDPETESELLHQAVDRLADVGLLLPCPTPAASQSQWFAVSPALRDGPWREITPIIADDADGHSKSKSLQLLASVYDKLAGGTWMWSGKGYHFPRPEDAAYSIDSPVTGACGYWLDWNSPQLCPNSCLLFHVRELWNCIVELQGMDASQDLSAATPLFWEGWELHAISAMMFLHLEVHSEIPLAEKMCDVGLRMAREETWDAMLPAIAAMRFLQQKFSLALESVEKAISSVQTRSIHPGRQDSIVPFVIQADSSSIALAEGPVKHTERPARYDSLLLLKALILSRGFGQHQEAVQLAEYVHAKVEDTELVAPPSQAPLHLMSSMVFAEVLWQCNEHSESLNIVRTLVKYLKSNPRTSHALSLLHAMQFCLAVGVLVGGEAKKAQTLFESVHMQRMQMYGEAGSRTVDALFGMSKAEMEQNNAAMALELCQSVVQLRSGLFGPNSISVLAAQFHYAQCLLAERNYTEALELHEEVLEKLTELLGLGHEQTLRSLGAVGTCLALSGKHKDALEVKEKTLFWRRKVHGKEHPLTLLAQRSVGVSASALGRHEEALSALEECSALSVKVFGSSDPRALQAVGAYSAALIQAGDVKGAVSMCSQMHVTAHEALGPDHELSVCARVLLSSLSVVTTNAADFEEEMDEPLISPRLLFSPDQLLSPSASRGKGIKVWQSPQAGTRPLAPPSPPAPVPELPMNPPKD